MLLAWGHFFGQRSSMAFMRLLDTRSPLGDEVRAQMAPTVYFTSVERLRAYLRIKNKRVRPRSHTRLKFAADGVRSDASG